MNKTILIIGGIILILLVVGIWVYLFMFGTPKKVSDVFANFRNSAGENNAPIATDQPTTNTDTQGGPESLKRLRQLTERPVAGAGFTPEGIRYMELGTGHIYDIVLTTNSEALVTGTTIPKIVDATFSGSGNRVVYTKDTDGVYEVSIGTITKSDSGSNVLDAIKLPENSKDAAFDTSGEEVHYLQVTGSGSSGRKYAIAKKSDTTLFSLPLRDIEILWGDDAVYAYTTPSGNARGYVYEIKNGVPAYLTSGQYSMMGTLWAGGIITTYLEGNVLSSYLMTDLGPKKQPVIMLPEKCVPGNREGQYLYCTAPVDTLGNTFPDAWYNGSVSFSDYLWKIDLSFQEAELVSNFAEESGREIDVKKIGISDDETKLYFINKNDNTLWLYDLSL